MAGRILIVATSHDKLGETGNPTGCWVEEVASPYYTWKAAGFAVDIASIKGGEIPFDDASKNEPFLTPEAKAFLEDKQAQEAVKNSKSLEQVLGGDVEHYDAVFIPGGHGIVYDGPKSNELKLLLETMWAGGKVVSAVCHGPAGLTTACGPDGKSILSGRTVTGFTNSEERAVGKENAVPFLLEDKMKELGGNFTAVADWGTNAVADGKLVTGQNPSSSKRVAELVIQLVKPGLREPVHGKGEHEGFHKRGVDVTGKHHDHRDEHPIKGVRHDQPDATYQRSSWHSSARPPI